MIQLPYTQFKFLKDKTTNKYKNSYLFTFQAEIKDYQYVGENNNSTYYKANATNIKVENNVTYLSSGSISGTDFIYYNGPSDDIVNINARRKNVDTEGTNITQQHDVIRFTYSAIKIEDMQDNGEDYEDIYNNFFIKKTLKDNTYYLFGIRSTYNTFNIADFPKMEDQSLDINEKQFTVLTSLESGDIFDDHKIIKKNINYLHIDPDTKQPKIYDNIIIIDVLQPDGTYETCVDNSIEVLANSSSNTSTRNTNSISTVTSNSFSIKVYTDYTCRLWCNSVQFSTNPLNNFSNNIFLEPGTTTIYVKKQYDYVATAEIYVEYKYKNIYIDDYVTEFLLSNSLYTIKGATISDNNTVYDDATFTSVFTIKYYDVDNSITYSNVMLSNNILNVEQPKKIVSSNYIVKPIVKTGVKYKWSDNLRDPVRYYDEENISTIETPIGIKKYGIRTKQNYVTGKYNGFNIPGRVVKLNSNIYQEFIYRFHTPAYLRIDPYIVENNANILEDYHYSYEYIVKNQLPDNNAQSNLLFFGATPQMTYTLIHNCLNKTYFDSYNTTQFRKNHLYTASYLYYDVSTYTYNLYNVSESGIRKNDYSYNFVFKNTTYNIHSKILEYKYDNLQYANITNLICDDFRLNSLELYSREYSYIRIIEPPVSYNNIYKYENDAYINIQRNSNYDGNLYYRIPNYVKLNTDVSQILNSADFDNLFMRNAIYTFKPKNQVRNSNNFTTYNQKLYIKPTSETNTYSYYEIKVGPVYDGSIKYYTNTYSYLRPTETNINPNEQIFIKVNYQPINNVDFDRYKNSHIIYRNISPVKVTTIANSVNISDIDLSGKKIYSNNTHSAFHRSELMSNVTQALSNLDSSHVMFDNITNISAYYGIFSSNEYKANTNDIKYQIEYDGLWEAVTITPRTKFTDFSEPLYIVGESYMPIDSEFVSLGSDIKFYKYRLDKVSPESLDFTSADKFGNVYMDITGILDDPDPSDNSDGIITIDNYDNPGDTIKLVKIDNKGVIDDTVDIDYYIKEYEYTETPDEFLSVDKEYFTYLPLLKSSRFENLIALNKPSTPNEKKKYDIDYTTAEIYKSEISYYKLSEGNPSWTTIRSNSNYAYFFLKSEFFYNTYTLNTGLEQESNGTYFTNIYTFDGTQGVVNSKLPLIQDRSTVTKYTYTINVKQKIDIIDKEQLNDIPLEHFNNYYIEVKSQLQAGETENKIDYIRLNEFSYTPETWFDIIDKKMYDTNKYVSYNLITYINSELSFNYDGAQDPGSYQYIDIKTLNPRVALVDDIIVGIIFKENYVANINKQTGNSNDPITIHPSEVLYYTYDGSHNVEFEPIELFESITNNKNELTIQDSKNFDNNIEKSISFSIENDVDINFTGGYTWHNPQHSSYLIFNGDSYTFYDVETYSGYWTRDYEKVNRPLHIAAYNFYAGTDTISNISATYSFIPNSYILTAIIEHPEITYKSLINEFEEYEYYTYIYDNNEYFYPFDDPVQMNPDGTYIGLAFKHHRPDADEFPACPVELIKHKSIFKNTSIKEITHQEPYVSYEYVAYKTPIALTNERVPILYSQEEQPARQHQVLIWDSNTMSYSVEVVTDTNSYFAYKYYYEEIPFKVSSYFFQASYFTIDNFDEIGTYIATGLSELSNNLNLKTESIDSMAETLSYDIQDFISYYNEYSYIRNSYSYNIGYSISYGFETLSYNNYNNVAYIASVISESFGSISYDIASSINSTSVDIQNSVQAQNNLLERELTYTRNDISYSIQQVSAGLHSDLVGEEPLTLPGEVTVMSHAYTGDILGMNVTDGITISTLGDILTLGLIGAEVEKVSYTNELGITTTQIKYAYHGVTDALQNLQISKRSPTKNQFITEVATTLYTNVDFENEIVDNVEYDSKGRIVRKQTHKANPQDMADKAIYRAGVLWNALNKGGFVEGELANIKQPTPSLPNIFNK